MANIEERVEQLVKKPIEDLGYSLYDVQYVKEGQDYFLRIFIEKSSGSIDLNDCEKVNNEINDLLDKADYIKEQYFLEVSSTGLEKVLRRDEHLKANIGKEVNIKLFKPIEIDEENKEETNKKKNNKKNTKQKELNGILQNFDSEKIIIELENEKIIQIERSNVSQIKLVFDWDSLG